MAHILLYYNTIRAYTKENDCKRYRRTQGHRERSSAEYSTNLMKDTNK